MNGIWLPVPRRQWAPGRRHGSTRVMTWPAMCVFHWWCLVVGNIPAAAAAEIARSSQLNRPWLSLIGQALWSVHHSTNHIYWAPFFPAKLGRTSCWTSSLRPSASVVSTSTPHPTPARFRSSSTCSTPTIPRKGRLYYTVQLMEIEPK
jgi:hypothetical protein